MCIMEIHPDMPYIDMIQAVAHNLSTIDRDLDMLGKLAEADGTHVPLDVVKSLQSEVNRAYAHALGEFGMEAAQHAMDAKGHIHREHGNERTIEAIIVSATEEAKADETR